ncbi:store-operated calcium entry-associated regulatory factor-like isoform X2 [Apostichopus japonicus]
MTTGKRSSPVPQMKCIGGSAGCNAFSPQVVQCSNKGSDGYDVQWECKTDMDNAYRFGMIEVICEGYDYPDDRYILKGSCGLEYTLDYTKEGMNQGKQQHNYYGDSSGNHYQDNHHDYNSGYASKRKSSFSDWIMLAICGLIIYGIYKSCMSSGHTGTHPDDDTNRRGGTHWGGGSGGGGNPPPPGFRPEYNPDSCSGTAGGSTQARAAGGQGLGGGNFWTGAAAGGLMGYLFGNRFGGRGYNQGYGGYGTGWGGGYARPRTYRQPSYGFSGFSGGGGGFSGGSTGTRSASGFGGTRRR